MKIIFFGTSDYCLPILDALKLNFELKLVVTRPDKPEGRHKTLTPSATKLWALKNNVAVITPATLKKDTTERLEIEFVLEQVHPDLAVVSDYGLIIPEKIFQFPRLGTINVHFSKLPDLRGPSPVQFTLLRGDDEAWITIFKLVNPPELEIKMDSGPIIFQQPFSILSDETTEMLYKRLFEFAGHHIINSVNAVADNVSMKSQDHSKATFCRFLTKEDGFIEWKVLEKAISGEKFEARDLPKIQQEALKTINFKFQISNFKLIHAFWRGVTTWPGMYTIINGKRMIIRKCHLEDQKLKLDIVQFAGKKPLAFTDARNVL